MAYEPKPGDGSLFKNDYKDSDKKPDATGYIIAHRDIREGEKLNLAAWTKDGGRGRFQSLRLSDVRTRQEPVADYGSNEPIDDEIPF